MNDNQNRSKQLLKLVLKIAVTVACFWYISTKINWKEAWLTIIEAKWHWLSLALLLYILSKIVSAFRLNIFFTDAGVRLNFIQNLKLYWLGMFYNLFLPGSISGDAYKVILLKKRFDSSYKKTSAAVLLDRISGLLGLGIILAIFGFSVFPTGMIAREIVVLVIIAILVFYLVIRKWLPDFRRSFISTLLLGVVVQALQVVCILFIMHAIGITIHSSQYIFIFLLSSIASVLPLTIGGLGIREVVFLEGSKWFGLVQETSVGISLIFYLLTVVASALGAYYVFKDPLQKIRDPKTDP